MAYNPYFPVSYQPYQQNYQQAYQPYYGQQSYQMPTQQMPPQNPIQQIQQSGIIWVNSGIEAQAYPVAPNNAVTLWSTAEPVVYLKKTDASGKPTLITYDLVERKDAPVSKEEPKVSYATKDDLTVVAGAVKSFDGLLSALKADVDAMKSDVYGLTGRKKKKGEDGDE